jgi:asparagine synthase (glutamine-hydrolysing)
LTRRKVGFPVPLRRWFDLELKDFVNDVLTDGRTRSRGYFDNRSLAALVDRSRAAPDLSPEMFSLLTLELWHREFIDEQRERTATRSPAVLV